MTRKIQILRGTNAQNNSFTGSIGELTMDTTKKEVRIHDGTTAGGKTVSAPTGLIASFGGSTAPDGWLVCDGSAVSRTDYADLFAVIGTTYGSGDGNSTFNLPEKYAYTGGVVGNGIAIGVTDDTDNYGLQFDYTNNTGGFVQQSKQSYGSSVGGNRNASPTSTKIIGLTTDPTKSGIICEKDSMIICIKY